MMWGENTDKSIKIISKIDDEAVEVAMLGQTRIKKHKSNGLTDDDLDRNANN